MTTLSMAARNYLAQDSDLRSLVGRSTHWPEWIFDLKPVGVKIENTSTCLIVINEAGTWTTPNAHNTMKFPRLQIDVWADPTRNTDRSVKVDDATDKIEAIQKYLDKHLHLIDPSTPQGMPTIWGTMDQIITHTGVVIAGSQRLTGPDLSPIRDSEGSWMGRYTYGVNQL